MKARFDHSVAETEFIRTFWFKPDRPLSYTAGQYTELTLQHENPDDRGVKHWFTLSSPPGHELVSITTKYAGDNKTSTFKRSLFNLAPGAVVELAEAMGDFVLPKDPAIPLVFIAGGIGLTPYHSIVEYVAKHGEQRDITLMYGVRHETDVFFSATFDRVHTQPYVVVSDPSPSWTGHTGALSAEFVIRAVKPSGNTLFYISGPEPMVETLQHDLVAAGVDQSRTVIDDFPGYIAI